MCPQIEDEMSALEFTAREWATALETTERKRSGASIPNARRSVARRIGVAPGSLENLSRGRTKGVRAFLYERIRAAFIRECEQELKRLAHELEMARQAGLRVDGDEVGEIEAHFAAIKELLK